MFWWFLNSLMFVLAFFVIGLYANLLATIFTAGISIVLFNLLGRFGKGLMFLTIFGSPTFVTLIAWKIENVPASLVMIGAIFSMFLIFFRE